MEWQAILVVIVCCGGYELGLWSPTDIDFNLGYPEMQFPQQ